MVLKNSIIKTINEQINAELYSSYLYLSMSAYFQGLGLKGFAHWMLIQSGEENGHAMKFFNYLADTGSKIELSAIAEPKKAWASPLEAMKEVCDHEAKVTGLINKLIDLALTEKDHATNAMLQWFISEQVEEESNAADIHHRLEMIGTSNSGLLYLDKEMGKRQ